MAKNDSITIRVHKNIVGILDKLIKNFDDKHGIKLSYSQITKKLAENIEEIKITSENILSKKIKINKEISLGFITKKIEVVKKIEAEHYASGYFKDLGYNVRFTKHLFQYDKKIENVTYSNPNENMFELLCLYDKYPELKNYITFVVGRPDLIVFNDNEVFFVEVKTNNDGLRPEQLEWILKHNNIKTYVFYLNQTVIENEKRNENYKS